MIGAGSLEFAHARIGARWGARPDEALWRRIETTRELAAVLDLARAGPLARWVEGIGPDAGVHAIERALRRHWRERVAEVAAWMPPSWHAALSACATLADLPLVQHLARGGVKPLWLDAAGHAQALALADKAAPEQVFEQWLQRWRASWPHEAGREAIEHELLPVLTAHAAAFAAPGPVDGWALRRTLHARLAALWRRAPVEPVAAFTYLALSALELERLRGELVPRAAFPRRKQAA